MVAASDPLDATLGRHDDVAEGVAGQGGQLHPLEAGPQRLDRVEVGRVGGRRLVSYRHPARTAPDHVIGRGEAL